MVKPEFVATFAILRALLKPYERHFVVVADKPDTHDLATKTSRTVSFHLIPVYAAPALLKGVSPSLLKRLQGKSCFNFTAIEPAHATELKALTKKTSTASSRSSSR